MSNTSSTVTFKTDPEDRVVVGRYARSVKAAHWLTAASIAIGVVCVLARDVVDAEAIRRGLLGAHRQAGLLVLALLLVRLWGRVWGHASAVGIASHAAPQVLPLWMRGLALLTHLALYAALVGMPLLGWALSDARGQHPAWLAWVPLPVLCDVDPDRADMLEEWHRWSAWGLCLLVTLHISAALWHHWVRRDDTLIAMWPSPRSTPGQA